MDREKFFGNCRRSFVTLYMLIYVMCYRYLIVVFLFRVILYFFWIFSKNWMFFFLIMLSFFYFLFLLKGGKERERDKIEGYILVFNFYLVNVDKSSC